MTFQCPSLAIENPLFFHMSFLYIMSSRIICFSFISSPYFRSSRIVFSIAVTQLTVKSKHINIEMTSFPLRGEYCCASSDLDVNVFVFGSFKEEI